MLTQRLPKSKTDLKRKSGKGPGPLGFACPESSKHFWEPTRSTPTIAELAFLHRHLTPTGKFGHNMNTGIKGSKRELLGRRFKVDRDNSMLTVTRPLWEVKYHAQGSPDGWRYRCLKLYGSYDSFHQEIAEISRFMAEIETLFPASVRLKDRRDAAHAWAVDRYGDGVIRWKGEMRFKDPNMAFEFRMAWT